MLAGIGKADGAAAVWTARVCATVRVSRPATAVTAVGTVGGEVLATKLAKGVPDAPVNFPRCVWKVCSTWATVPLATR